MQATPESRPPAPRTAEALSNFAMPTLSVVDDDGNVREAIRAVLEHDGWTVEVYSTAEDFLDAWQPGCGGCLLVDAYLPGMDGLELLRRLHGLGHRLPAIMITGRADGRPSHESGRSGLYRKADISWPVARQREVRDGKVAGFKRTPCFGRDCLQRHCESYFTTASGLGHVASSHLRSYGSSSFPHVINKYKHREIAVGSDRLTVGRHLECIEGE
jgi:CheY-like chemotaxis protein